MTSILLFIATGLSLLLTGCGIWRRNEMIVLASVKCSAEKAKRSSKEQF